MPIKNVALTSETLKYFVLHPTEARSKQERVRALVASIALAIFTLGIFHIVAAALAKKYKVTLTTEHDANMTKLYQEIVDKSHKPTKAEEELVLSQAEQGDSRALDSAEKIFTALGKARPGLTLEGVFADSKLIRWVYASIKAGDVGVGIDFLAKCIKYGHLPKAEKLIQELIRLDRTKLLYKLGKGLLKKQVDDAEKKDAQDKLAMTLLYGAAHSKKGGTYVARAVHEAIEQVAKTEGITDFKILDNAEVCRLLRLAVHAHDKDASISLIFKYVTTSQPDQLEKLLEEIIGLNDVSLLTRLGADLVSSIKAEFASFMGEFAHITVRLLEKAQLVQDTLTEEKKRELQTDLFHVYYSTGQTEKLEEFLNKSLNEWDCELAAALLKRCNLICQKKPSSTIRTHAQRLAEAIEQKEEGITDPNTLSQLIEYAFFTNQATKAQQYLDLLVALENPHALAQLVGRLGNMGVTNTQTHLQILQICAKIVEMGNQEVIQYLLGTGTSFEFKEYAYALYNSSKALVMRYLMEDTTESLELLLERLTVLKQPLLFAYIANELLGTEEKQDVAFQSALQFLLATPEPVTVLDKDTLVNTFRTAFSVALKKKEEEGKEQLLGKLVALNNHSLIASVVTKLLADKEIQDEALSLVMRLLDEAPEAVTPEAKQALGKAYLEVLKVCMTLKKEQEGEVLVAKIFELHDFNTLRDFGKFLSKIEFREASTNRQKWELGIRTLPRGFEMESPESVMSLIDSYSKCVYQLLSLYKKQKQDGDFNRVLEHLYAQNNVKVLIHVVNSCGNNKAEIMHDLATDLYKRIFELDQSQKTLIDLQEGLQKHFVRGAIQYIHNNQEEKLDALCENFVDRFFPESLLKSVSEINWHFHRDKADVVVGLRSARFGLKIVSMLLEKSKDLTDSIKVEISVFYTSNFKKLIQHYVGENQKENAESLVQQVVQFERSYEGVNVLDNCINSLKYSNKFEKSALYYDLLIEMYSAQINLVTSGMAEWYLGKVCLNRLEIAIKENTPDVASDLAQKVVGLDSKNLLSHITDNGTFKKVLDERHAMAVTFATLIFEAAVKKGVYGADEELEELNNAEESAPAAAAPAAAASSK